MPHTPATTYSALGRSILPLQTSTHIWGIPPRKSGCIFFEHSMRETIWRWLGWKITLSNKMSVWAVQAKQNRCTSRLLDALRIWSQQNKHLNYIQIRNFQTRLRLSIATACRFGTSNCWEENSMIWFFSGMPSCLELVFLPRSLLLGRARYLWNWVGPCDTPSEPSLVWKFLRLDDLSFITFCFVVRLLCIA